MFILPALVTFAVNFLTPFILNMCLSFYGFAAMASTEFVKLNGCTGVLKSKIFLRSL